MGTLTAYSLQTAVFLLAGYLIYKWLMAQEKQIAFNRWIILGIYVISFTAKPLAEAVGRISVPLGDAAVRIDTLGLTPVSVVDAGVPMWPLVIVAVYFAGMTVTAVWTVIVILRLLAIIRSGSTTRYHGYTLVILDTNTVAPFSWGRYIVMSRDDYSSAGEMITAHELAHIGHRHCIDLLIAQLVCILQWFNPASWLLREELKSVHEFQADDSVISRGVDARQYQLLLIKKAVGTRFQSIANSLNHSNLKKRITMMYNQTTSGRRRLRGLALVPALAVALAVTNLPAVASVLSSTGSATLESAANSRSEAPVIAVKVTQKEAKTQDHVSQAMAEKRAQFPGGEGEMYHFLAMNIKFPPKLIEDNVQGKVVVQFTVQPNGSLTDFEVVRSLSAEADAEALRVVKEMPKWEPALSEGKAVASTYVIPVSFKLAPDKKDKK